MADRLILPEYDGHYVCLIGLTKRARPETEGTARRIAKDWDYSIFSNRCQHHLRPLADEVHVEEIAAGYRYFHENTQIDCQDRRQPPTAARSSQRDAEGAALHDHAS